MDNFLVAPRFLSLFFVIGMIGVYILLRSPALLKMNRKRNSCTKETKFVWQKEYKSKKLCSLSAVKKAGRISGISTHSQRLYIRLRYGKEITVFSDFSVGPINYEHEFIEMENKINQFLASNEEECIVKYSLFKIGCVYFGVAFFASLSFIFFMCYSG